MYTIRVPYFVDLGPKQRFYLNLNQYRNAHYHTLNNAKIKFARIVDPLIQEIPALNGAKFSYRLFYKTRGMADVSNICAVVDKFFCDAFVSAKKLEDDNYTIVPGVEYIYGGRDPTNPGVEIVIYPL